MIWSQVNLHLQSFEMGRAMLRFSSLAVVVAVSLASPALLCAEDAAEHISQAKSHLEKREFDKAIADCDKAIETDFNSAEAYNIRGWAWSDKHEDEKALADCNQAIALDPQLADAYFNRAWVFDRRGEDEKTIQDLKRALAITPDDWNTLNNFGVQEWKLAQKQEAKAAAAEAAGDLETAKSCRQKCAALKNDAKAQWIHGVAANPQAWDIHSNLGYAYSEANDLNKAEFHLRRAVEIKSAFPRLHNNLGRVLLRESQMRDAEARVAEVKGKTDPADAAKARKLKDEAKAMLNEAIGQFERSAKLDKALLEPRLNLGEVYSQLGELDKADAIYQDILRSEEFVKAHLESIKDPDIRANLGFAYLGLARLAIARKKPDEAIRHLQKAIDWNPKNLAALQLLAAQFYERGDYPEGERVLCSWLAKLSPAARPKAAEQFARQLDDAGDHEAAAKARTAAKATAENSLKK
jgi:tetratricopeptide (TPR) repeat protein